MEMNLKSIHEAIGKLKVAKKEPFIESFGASSETIEVLKKNLPAVAKADAIVSMYTGIKITEKPHLPFGMIQANFTDGNIKIFSIL